MKKTHFLVLSLLIATAGVLTSCEDPKLGLVPANDQSSGANAKPTQTPFIDLLPANAQVVLTSSPLSGGETVLPPIPLVDANPLAAEPGDESGWVQCQSALLPPTEDGVYVRILGIEAHIQKAGGGSEILSSLAPQGKAYLFNLITLSDQFLQGLGSFNLQPGQTVDWVRLKICRNNNFVVDPNESRELTITNNSGNGLKIIHAPQLVTENKEYQLKLTVNVGASFDFTQATLEPSIQATWLESP